MTNIRQTNLLTAFYINDRKTTLAINQHIHVTRPSLTAESQSVKKLPAFMKHKAHHSVHNSLKLSHIESFFTSVYT
jgi:hypothetical protein